jgi:uncharacterized membrane protein
MGLLAEEETRMERVERSIEVDCPVRTVYNQWTQFEEFPRFISGLKEVKQLDDLHVHWHAAIWGRDKEWDSEIVEQVPDERISWRSTRGEHNNGTVRFEPLPGDRTLVHLSIVYEPKGVVETAGYALGIFERSVDAMMHDFKAFIERRQTETGAWRGEVRTSLDRPSPGATTEPRGPS